MSETTLPAAADLELTARASFAHWSHEILRFSDTDAVGHVNNGAYASCLETARIKLTWRLGREPEEGDVVWVLARLCIDFRAQLFYPGEVDVGTALLALGRSSITMAQGLFRDDVCCATATAVLVLIDKPSAKSTPIPQSLRARLAALAEG